MEVEGNYASTVDARNECGDGLSRQVRTLFDGRVQLLVFDMHHGVFLGPARDTALVLLGQMESSPDAQLVLVVREEFNLLRIHRKEKWRGAMGVDHKNFFPVVFLSVNERQKEAAWFTGKNILQKSCLEVPLQHVMVPHSVLAIAQQTCIASSRCWVRDFLDFPICGVSEPQHELAESFLKVFLF
jgi:hypothetical protein